MVTLMKRQREYSPLKVSRESAYLSGDRSDSLEPGLVRLLKCLDLAFRLLEQGRQCVELSLSKHRSSIHQVFRSWREQKSDIKCVVLRSKLDKDQIREVPQS